MKIVHLIFALNTGGAETMLIDVVNEQISVAEVSLIIINKTYNERLLQTIDERAKVYFINRNEGSRNPLNLIKLNILLYRLDADILHCHNHNIIALIFPFLRRNAILSLHCLRIPSRHLKKYNKLYSISRSVRKDVLNRANIDSIVIYNGIQTDLIHIKDHHSIGLTFKVVQIGRLDHGIKGQHLVIEALNLLRGIGITNIHLDLIGTGESEKFLKDLIKHFDLENQVSFLGLKDRSYIYSHLRNYDLLIQPSLDEGFGLTITEAMAAKVPVLVSDIDGPMEVIANGMFGFFFKSNDISSLTLKIKDIVENYGRFEIEEITEKAFQFVYRNFSIINTAQEFIEHYSDNPKGN